MLVLNLPLFYSLKQRTILFKTKNVLFLYYLSLKNTAVKTTKKQTAITLKTPTMAQVLAEKLIKAAKKHQQDFFKKNTLNGANPDREIDQKNNIIHNCNKQRQLYNKEPMSESVVAQRTNNKKTIS